MKNLQYVKDKYAEDPLFMFTDFSDPNAVVDGDDTILHVAVLRNDVDVVDALLESGANVNAIGDMGFTPLHVACRVGNLNVVKKLISAGAKISLNAFGSTPIDRAREYGFENIVEYIESENGGEKVGHGSGGMSPLRAAQ